MRLAENLDESKPLTDPTRRTGRLALYITGEENHQFRRRWWDTKSQRLERMLGPFIETLVNALEVKRQQRLDAECVSRQRKEVERIRKECSRDASREFYARQELMQNVQRWVDAQRVRGYLASLKAASEAEEWKPSDQQQFEKWFGWATRFANSIDPVISAPIPETKSPERKNIAVCELDLTVATRRIVERLGVANTDELWKQKQDQVRTACDDKFGPAWNEITRVLEALGYDVSKREQAYEWM